MAAHDMHRIGGADVPNLRLKPREMTLVPPGISVLRAPSPGGAARQIRAAFPKAGRLVQQAGTVGSSTEQLIRAAGFDIIAASSATLPNHYRTIHPDGVAGFTDDNLARLAGAFTNTTGH